MCWRSGSREGKQDHAASFREQKMLELTQRGRSETSCLKTDVLLAGWHPCLREIVLMAEAEARPAC